MSLNESKKIFYDSNIYNKRKDILLIKSKLLELVPDPEYWNVLKLFIYGKCSKTHFDNIILNYLKTSETKKLHNDFIRSILFNAHFSNIPPPNYIPKKIKNISFDNIIQEKQFFQKPTELQPKNCSDIKKIPDFELFFKIIQLKIIKSNFNFTKDAIINLYNELINFLINLLKNCILNIDKSKNYPRNYILLPKHISSLILQKPEIKEILSSNLLSKLNHNV